jgi:lipoate-protein ligase A
MFGSLRNAYCEIHTRLAKALRAIGVDAVLAGRPPRPSVRPTSCFAVPVGGEILVQGRKLVGSAQVRRDQAFLQHGSILLEGSQAKVGAVHNEITLSTVLGRAVTFEEVATAIIKAWGEPAFRPSAVASLAAE